MTIYAKPNSASDCSPFENEWYFCLFARQQHAWFYPSDERFWREPRLGQGLEARVIGYRAVDWTFKLVSSHVHLRCWENDA